MQMYRQVRQLLHDVSHFLELWKCGAVGCIHGDNELHVRDMKSFFLFGHHRSLLAPSLLRRVL